MGKCEVTTPEQWDLPSTMFHDEWKSFIIHFHNFAELPTTKGHSLESPEFTCNGQKWNLRLYPGGLSSDDNEDDEAPLFTGGCCVAREEPKYISVYLVHRSQGSTKATFEVKIINKYGDTLETRRSSDNRPFDIRSSISGWSDMISLSEVLNETDVLDSNGTLTVIVSMMPTPLKLNESLPVPKIASSTLEQDEESDDEQELEDEDSSVDLPDEPSWFKELGLVDNPSNEGVEVDQLDISRQPESIDHSTLSADPPNVYDSDESLGQKVYQDDEVSKEESSVEGNTVSISTLDKLGLPSSTFHDEWESFLVRFHNFAEIPITEGLRLESPEFTCNGQKWALRLYPSGNASADANGYISVYLVHRSRGSATATFEVKIINKFRDTLETRTSSNDRQFDSSSSNSGWGNIIKLSDVLDESNDILDNKGALTVVISMKNKPIPAEKDPPFIDRQNDVVLKKLIVKCLLKNELLPDETVIGKSKGKALKLQGENPSQEARQLPQTRDPPESCQPETHVRMTPKDTRNPPRPEEVRYQLYSSSGNFQQPKAVCAAPIQNDFHSLPKSYCSTPSQYQLVRERVLSSHAMDRRRHYKEMLLQQQLAQTQAKLAEVQRQLASDHLSTFS